MVEKKDAFPAPLVVIYSNEFYWFLFDKAVFPKVAAESASIQNSKEKCKYHKQLIGLPVQKGKTICKNIQNNICRYS